MTLESAVQPLDLARGAALRFATRSRLLTGIVGRRDVRLAWLATVQVLGLFLVAVHAPVLLFFLGPIALGVVHLAADVRYLALRRAPPRALLVASVGIAVAVTVARVAGALGVVDASTGDRGDAALGMAWVGVALAFALVDRRSWRHTGFVLPAFACVAACVVIHARLVGLVMVHLHNVVALVAWLLLFRRRAGWTLVPIALVASLALVLGSGVTLPWTFLHGGMFAFGTRIESLGAWMAPGLDTRFAVALATTFVFMQGVHYAVWTGWIPQDALPGEGTPTYRQTVRGLVADFGRPALGLIVATALGLVVLALWNVRGAVSWYMTLAKSHAWFECAFLAYFLVRRDAS